MKQTAVNWLIHILKGQQDKPFTYDEWMIAMEHAQEMEKEQIIDAHNCGYSEGIYQSCESGEEYYNETFKSE